MMSKYAGMTVNERLFAAGLLDGYYRALEVKDRESMIQYLVAVELDPDQVERTANTALSDPVRYGRTSDRHR
jgi:hypothetical protein